MHKINTILTLLTETNLASSSTFFPGCSFCSMYIVILVYGQKLSRKKQAPRTHTRTLTQSHTQLLMELMSVGSFVRGSLCHGELLSGGAYVMESFCPGELMSWRAYVRGSFCPGELMSWRAYVRGSIYFYVRGSLCPWELLSGGA